MIPGIMITFVAMVLFLLNTVFSALNFVLPEQVSNGVVYFFSYLGYLSPIFPVDTLMQAVGVYLVALIAWYIVKLILWVVSHIPFLNAQPLPSISHVPTQVGGMPFPKNVIGGRIDYNEGRKIFKR